MALAGTEAGTWAGTSVEQAGWAVLDAVAARAAAQQAKASRQPHPPDVPPAARPEA
jgi:hypothetical protein